MISIDAIVNANHIAIKSIKKTLPHASALYSYALTQHKKVSWISEGLDRRFSFLPWYDAIRLEEKKSADYTLEADMAIMELYRFFIDNSIKINKKMATALYTGFFVEYENFTSKECNGTVFAAVGKLIELGAEHQLAVEHIIKSKGLNLIRLKSLLFSKVRLIQNATVAYVEISDDDLRATGTLREDLDLISKELLEIAHVQEVQINYKEV